jgi:hypothetical protein
MSDLLPADDQQTEIQPAQRDVETTGVMAPYEGPYPAPTEGPYPPPTEGPYAAPSGGSYPPPAVWVRPEPGSWESSLPAPATQMWAAPLPPPTAPAAMAAAAAVETVTCPACGTTASVAMNRRDATDFCAKCDYPLFWTPSNVVHGGPADTNDLALRRLPGTVGRATIASRDCPHCAEPNTVTAQVCVRCHGPMFPVAEPEPIPVPVYVPPPPPVYEEPKPRVAWWVWALLYLVVAATVVVIVLIVTHRIN